MVAQVPNFALWVVLGASALAYLLPAGTPAQVAHAVTLCGLVVWASDEILRGVNPWRRLLGGAVLAYLLAGRLLD